MKKKNWLATFRDSVLFWVFTMCIPLAWVVEPIVNATRRSFHHYFRGNDELASKKLSQTQKPEVQPEPMFPKPALPIPTPVHVVIRNGKIEFAPTVKYRKIGNRTEVIGNTGDTSLHDHFGHVVPVTRDPVCPEDYRQIQGFEFNS